MLKKLKLNRFKSNLNPDEDVFYSVRKDRRLLNYIPDFEGMRSNLDRRGLGNKDISKYKEKDYTIYKKKGERYDMDAPITIVVIGDDWEKHVIKGTTKDISETGILFSVDNYIDFDLIKNSTSLKLKFSIDEGAMPEGFEMKIKMNATVARTFSKDGEFFCGALFEQGLKQYAKVRKDRRRFIMSSLMLAFISACIMLMRSKSFVYFRFHEFLYMYSIIAAVFLLSGYIFSAFYKPVGVDPNFTPGVTVIIPCFNEEEWIHRTIIDSLNQDYPPEKLEVIVVDDCSTDRSVERIKETIELIMDNDNSVNKVKGRVSYYVQPQNAGKREALVEGVIRAKHELVVFVDSDSFLDPYAIRNIVQPFRDPKMGGVSGRTDVANTYTNGLTKMQAVRYYIAFRVMKAAEGLFDCVTCLSGPLSCYKKEIVLEKKDEWLNQSFLGQKATFGDDRSMTNYVLKGHRTFYQDTAVCSTIVPNKYSVFLKQQMRWKRSWLRESLRAGTFIWKKEPFAAIRFYLGLIVPIAAPFIILYNLIYVPLTQNIFPTTFLIGLGLMALMMSAAQMFFRKSTTWIYAIWFCIYYELVLVWQMPIAILTFWKSTWGTRMTWSDVAESEKEKRTIKGRIKCILSKCARKEKGNG